jgi:hypothetical protein
MTEPPAERSAVDFHRVSTTGERYGKSIAPFHAYPRLMYFDLGLASVASWENGAGPSRTAGRPPIERE